MAEVNIGIAGILRLAKTIPSPSWPPETVSTVRLSCGSSAIPSEASARPVHRTFYFVAQFSRPLVVLKSVSIVAFQPTKTSPCSPRYFSRLRCTSPTSVGIVIVATINLSGRARNRMEARSDHESSSSNGWANTSTRVRLVMPRSENSTASDRGSTGTASWRKFWTGFARHYGPSSESSLRGSLNPRESPKDTLAVVTSSTNFAGEIYEPITIVNIQPVQHQRILPSIGTSVRRHCRLVTCFLHRRSNPSIHITIRIREPLYLGSK